ncbi:major facilitator superfamily transporter protein [Rutstroemia sp. NJR-2017a BVV2]|nr:major facilitator superfamily transporter protein [Rutstroemia sp. NJR-2017a BVV2]
MASREANAQPVMYEEATVATDHGMEKNIHHNPSNHHIIVQEKEITSTSTSFDGLPPTQELNEPDSHDDITYPEGGTRAWLVVFGSWCGMFASFGISNSLGSFQAYVSANQLSAYSESQVGWIFSLYVFFTLFGGIYVGPIFDMYGPKWLLLIGCTMNIIMIFVIGFCDKYWQWMVVFSVIGGIASSLSFTPSIAAVGHWFNKKRGNATGIAATGGAFGGVIFPLLLEDIIPKIGFAWATRVIGFILLFTSILANLLIRSRLPPPRTTQFPHPDLRILTKPAFALTVLGVYLLEWAFFQPITYITSYALYEGFPSALSYQVLPILSAASVFGRFLPGLISDKIGRFNALLVALFISMFGVFVIWLPFGNTYPGLIIFAIVVGFGTGSNISLTPVCVSQLCDTKDYGRYYATCYSVVSFGCLTGVPIGGALIQACGGAYWGLIIFTGCCYTASTVAMTAARGYGGGWGLNIVF